MIIPDHQERCLVDDYGRPLGSKTCVEVMATASFEGKVTGSEVDHAETNSKEATKL